MTAESLTGESPLHVLRRQFGLRIASLLTPEQQDQVADVFRLLADAEGEALARAWMIGRNPFLGDDNPILTIADGRPVEVQAAARAYLGGQWA